MQVASIVRNGKHVLDLIQEHNADEIVAVLPLQILAEITQSSRYKPIRAVGEPSVGIVDGEKVYFHHSYFERVMSVDVVTRPLTMWYPEKRRARDYGNPE